VAGVRRRKLARDTITIAVQVNGKLRGQMRCRGTPPRTRIRSAPGATTRSRPFLEGKPIKREIYVKGKLVNLGV